MIDLAPGTNGEEPPGVSVEWFLSINLLLSPFLFILHNSGDLRTAAKM